MIRLNILRGIALLAVIGALSLTPVWSQEATPESAAPAVTTLRLWFPDTLSTPADADTAGQISELIAAFEADNPDARVDFRWKRADDAATPGSVAHNLQTARAVAPGALPHVTLLRRADLVAAAREGLIAPLDDLSEVLDGLLPAAGPLGMVDSVAYGAPFALEAQHLALQNGLVPPASAALTDWRAVEWPFAFAAAQAPANDLLIAQLAEAGGVGEDGTLAPGRDALTALYEFYADALESGLLPPETLVYDDPSDYLAALAAGDMAGGVVTSTAYLNLRAQGASLDALPLPTLDGGPASVLDGWVWVLPAGNPQERALALRFIRWMSAPERQAAFATAAGVIPASQAAFEGWADGDYGALITDLLGGALPLAGWAASQPDGARAVQAGLQQVLNGAATPEEAVLAALGSPESP